MPWGCSSSTNNGLVDNLVTSHLVTYPSAIAAMRAVDRSLFVPETSKSDSYADRPLPIGWDATISAPHMHAMMLDIMAPHLGPGKSALDVGSGSGYIVACIAKLGATAFGIEHIDKLVARSIETVSQVAPDGNWEIREGDGRLGWPEKGPFDVIHVGAAALPGIVEVLMGQLKKDGILIIPVEDASGDQVLYKCTFAEDGSIQKEQVCGVRFVPLTDVR
jgi:protein-L-isoaspartate(D-aspartate) O-methyltransferase